MRDEDFRVLRRSLLQGGVAPKHVERTLRELRHHFADLEHRALAEGLDAKEASAQAAQQLGDQELIIAEALARPELRSWAHRWPWGFYGLLPVLALILAVVGSMVAIASLLDVAQSNSGLSEAAFANALFENRWMRTLLESWRVGTVYVLPVAFAGWLCVYAARRGAPILWPAIGAFLLLFLGFCFDLSIAPPPDPDSLARFGVSLGFGAEFLVSVRVLRLLIPLLLVLGPYYWWRNAQREYLA